MYLIVTTIIIGLLIILYYLRKTKKNKIAIVGLSGAGKTRYFFSKFNKSQDIYTTSLRINSGVIDNVEWFDVPGNEKIFKVSWDSIRNEISSVYFLIDSVGFYKERKDVAKRLDDIYRDYRKKIGIILVQNQDNRALEREKIEILLDKELKELKEIRRKNVDVDQDQDYIEEYSVDFYIKDEMF
jgi:signal recognition particle receptor subunit beta